MINIKLNFYFKLFLAVIFGFGFSYFIGKEVFLGFTPRVNPFFAKNVSLNIKTSLNKIFLVFKNNKNNNINIAENPSSQATANTINNILVNSLKPIGKGVEAASYGNHSYIKYKLGEVEWIETELKKQDGTILKIKVPKLNN